MLGFSSDAPEPGELLVCLANDYKTEVLNGSSWLVDTSEIRGGIINLTLQSTQDSNDAAVRVDLHSFVSGTPPPTLDLQQFAFGYCLTVHKAQGSEWPRVLVIDQNEVFGTMGERWLYTAATRAREHVTFAWGVQ
jgi:exodeoxyribonuclease-5